MNFQCTIKGVETYSVTYTKKQLEHHSGKRKLSLDEYFNEKSDDKTQTEYHVKRKNFELSGSDIGPKLTLEEFEKRKVNFV